MESVVDAAETASSARPYRWAKIFMAVITTALIFMMIYEHWSTFGPSKKVVAVALVINLLLSSTIRPRLSIFKYLERNENDPDYLVMDGYTCVFLVAMLFT
jgi:hypothetical protein